ncbi:urease accessory protein [Mangrovactinospora gilvigrisea]|uniref:Urease accessory protein UreD n=1 Tax=Mangrovactinospora gilvigrisea TaxID=1428644 RepID=A0A1J7BEQ1_9ACTN|nr:urease accessory protein UreD [Mangrovactinospora gilvigrisea]OIV37163.1 urease accessory protein [Mangrovactinospora gilvigrisea]
MTATDVGPERVPAAVRAGAGPPDTLGAGRPAKVGRLELRYERRGARTELTHRHHTAPLSLTRPLYIDPALPGTPVSYLMSTGGGVVQADRLAVDVEVGPGAHALVTTQAATRLHRCDFDHAAQSVRLAAEDGAVLEYLPDPLIPYAGSRFHQQTRITVAESATVIAAETVTAGRLARGERHAYTALALDLEIVRPDGELLAVDTVRLVPGQDAAGGSVDGPAVLGGHDVMASLFAVCPGPAAELADALHAALDGVLGGVSDGASDCASDGVRFGVSTLPDDCGAWLRILGDHPPAVTRALRAAWGAARRATIGADAPDLRKN